MAALEEEAAKMTLKSMYDEMISDFEPVKDKIKTYIA